MLVFKYHTNKEEGTIKPFMSKNEFRKLMKGSFINSPKEIKFETSERDFFKPIGVSATYNDNSLLISFGIGFYGNEKLFYKDINLFNKLGILIEKFKEKNIKYTIEDYGLQIENGHMVFYIYEMTTDDNDPAFKEQKVGSIRIVLKEIDCSLSFDRYISNHIPSKKCYENSKMTAGEGPAVLVFYNHQKYFASHGKSKATKKYLEMQKQLVAEGKVSDVVEQDIADIKGKTSSLYSSGIKQMKDYFRTLNPDDFKPIK